MKRKLILTGLIGGICYLTLSSYIYGPATDGWDCTGAETACTGTYINYTGCYGGSSSCHSTSSTTGITLSLTFDSAGVATSHYVGGHTYTVKIAANNGSGTVFPLCGFQLTSMKGAASASVVYNAGTWSATGLPAHTIISPPHSPYDYLNVVEHDTALTVTNDTFSRTFTWTAPVAGTGTVSFWGAVNFVNGTENTSGTPNISQDLWNTKSLIINEWPIDNAVATVSGFSALEAFPNPATSQFTLKMNQFQPGTYSLQVFDVNGKCTYTQTLEPGNAAFAANIPTSNWVPGTYIVIIQGQGCRQELSLIKL